MSAETTLPETGLLVMWSEKFPMDKLLAALRTAGIRIPHKAVLRQPTRTGTPISWQELERERQAMENADLRMQCR
ncbi:MAG: hypothetical protein ACLR5S_11510 [Ruminococcus sp.]